MHNPPASAHLIGLPSVILCQRLGSGAVQTVFGTFDRAFFLTLPYESGFWQFMGWHASGRHSKTGGKSGRGREADGTGPALAQYRGLLARFASALEFPDCSLSYRLACVSRTLGFFSFPPRSAASGS